ncbi:site-specific integrase [Nodularia sphaerocarpa]|uniref:site-specific integrase n=1 Tax=Nodularia sphaerocarpa TaxID=137816 RepID=UPI001EFB6F68|nr:tyrosine-type recombinase/integrase [Nodularia sphaerocarpa]MDB9376131.1 tyrosine-type recombinase/integrase [Nodularia sphaerocarpa CS-585]ULP73423.1 Tyrosine recombinase XerC [Nodularia sphaerocarpa UHCC 0038]
MKVGIECLKGRLRLRLPRALFGGNQKYLSLHLSDSAENRLLAEMKARQIELDILAGHFDFSLAKYKIQTDVSIKAKVYNLLEIWEQYTQFKRNQVQESTLLRDYSLISKRIQALPTTEINDAVIILNHLLSIYSAEITKRTVKQFNACCNWAVTSQLIVNNPFKDLAKTIKTKRKDNNILTFSQQEIGIIIDAFASNKYCPKYSPLPHSYYTNYVRCLFLTGCRPEEAVALKWKHISSTHITFAEAVPSDVRIRKDTKTHQTRLFPINGQLRELLNDIGYGDALSGKRDFQAEKLLFCNRNGRELNTHNFLNRVWKPVLTRLVNDHLIRYYLPQYNCRHSFITLCLEAGISVKQVADMVGNSAEVIYKHYSGVIKQVEVPEIFYK